MSCTLLEYSFMHSSRNALCPIDGKWTESIIVITDGARETLLGRGAASAATLPKVFLFQIFIQDENFSCTAALQIVLF